MHEQPALAPHAPLTVYRRTLFQLITVNFFSFTLTMYGVYRYTAALRGVLIFPHLHPHHLFGVRVHPISRCTRRAKPVGVDSKTTLQRTKNKNHVKEKAQHILFFFFSAVQLRAHGSTCVAFHLFRHVRTVRTLGSCVLLPTPGPWAHLERRPFCEALRVL